MELKYAIALYICAGVAAVFVIAAFINVRFKRKYKKGKKTYLPDYIKNDPKFKSKMFWYAVLKYILIVLIITSLLLSGFLMARPYKTESKELANYNRDIILCAAGSRNFNKVKRTVLAIDSVAFMTITSVNEVNGNGFTYMLADEDYVSALEDRHDGRKHD